MPLPSSYLSTEERTNTTATQSNYFDAKEIEDNATAELIICGEPDDHMVAGWQYFLDKDEEGKSLGCKISRNEPTQEEYVKDCGLAFKVTATKAAVLKQLNQATGRKEEWEALKQLSRPQYFLAFAAYHVERDDFVCMKVAQRSLLSDIEKYLRMEEDYMPITPGGLYNFRLLVEKSVEGEGDNTRTTYGATVRIHRKSEAAQVEEIAKRWEKEKEGMWLPRYFMEKGANNVFDGKPLDAVLPKGMPVTARDEYGSDAELKGF